MTDEKPTIARGDEYVVLYSKGPFDGQTDTRISTDGSWDDELTVLAAFDGKETMENYNVVQAVEIGGRVQVTYTWDRAESEPSDDPADRLQNEA